MDERTLEQIIAQGTVDVVIDDYGFTGEGYVRLADGWLSVHGTLPGEKVRVRVDVGEEHGRRIFGILEQVLDASPERRDPLCARDAVCRGCQLRHVTVNEELGYHVRTVREVIEKFAGVPEDEQPHCEIITPQPIARGDAFRIRSALTYRRTDDTCELGLNTPVQEALVPMFDCPALTTPVRRLVATVREAFMELDELPWDEAMALRARDEGAEIAPAIRTVSVASPVIGRGFVDVRLSEIAGEDVLERAITEGPVAALVARLEEMLPDEVGLAVSVGERRAHLSGPERLLLPIAGLKIEVGYEDWFPATIAPSDALYDALLELLDLREDDAFLDVGTGIGTIAILAAKRVERVVGVDINRSSVSTAELNAVANEATNAEFVVGGWENALRKLTLDGQRFTAASINPMREPLGKRALTYLKALGVRRLVYLGPSPASAAKDIGELRQMGWKLDHLAAANIHPATYHTMLVARLTLD
ncbi:class I SAM-dependent RNA methyltransferase [Persicimonas caeni]|uniref:Class I SAM-dependent RNA methyltransferase n=1 Tax=Persicimonas caeni TaxID=2292766 RepID=A0A4Y6PXW4_PERCE|nr:methyltransferase domain-containing protein [Persicimonas caeni]QDG53178.1 class I SAM-dependent RNA methyltransferase [Persicimonas caeni]QED34400.1 class I SAM-dependent RNA methyltransferase [Persicimonas caeni]